MLKKAAGSLEWYHVVVLDLMQNELGLPQKQGTSRQDESMCTHTLYMHVYNQSCTHINAYLIKYCLFDYLFAHKGH